MWRANLGKYTRKKCYTEHLERYKMTETNLHIAGKVVKIR